MRKINEIIVHCSATPEGKDFHARDIDRWHRQRGWNGIGYHWVVDLDGKIEQGRPERLTGAHCQGHNAHSIGVCYIGGVDAHGKPKDTRTEAQKASLLTLLRQLRQRYPNARIIGHRSIWGEDTPQKWQKACPSFNAQQEYAAI